jgi:hypothetical protein
MTDSKLNQSGTPFGNYSPQASIAAGQLIPLFFYGRQPTILLK